jgi:glycosyltransferase involved in cell wall biosynthesis
MRILVAADQWFPGVRGGVARLAAESAERLAARGHDVTVIAPAGADDGRTSATMHFARPLRRGRLPRTFTDPIETARAARRLSGDFDVLLAHTSTTAEGLLRARLGAPLVLVFHASAVLELEFLRPRLPLGWRRLTARAIAPRLAVLERRSLSGAARVLVLSEFTRSLLAGRHPDASRSAVTVPAGIDTRVFAPGDREAARRRLGVDPGETIVFTARRLVPRMGLDRLIDATALLGGVPRLRTVIAGTGMLRASLERRATGAEPRVSFVGDVSDAELVDWYRSADVFVLPTVAYEGFGMATAESLASGTPVVATPVGATPEVLRPLDARFISDGIEPAELAAAIRRALDLLTPELRDRCRDYAVERFSWDAALPVWEDELADAARA